MNQNDGQEEVVSIGIPDCECHRCFEELIDEESDEVVITMDALKDWMSRVCPGTKAA